MQSIFVFFRRSAAFVLFEDKRKKARTSGENVRAEKRIKSKGTGRIYSTVRCSVSLRVQPLPSVRVSSRGKILSSVSAAAV